MTHTTVDVNGLAFAVDVRGPDDGPPVVLQLDATDEVSRLRLDFLRR